MADQRGEMLLWLSDARGVYIPRDFATSFADRDKSVKGVSQEQWEILEKGPHDNESYWDTWDKVIYNARITDEDGIEYTIWQDGDCWLIPKGMEYNEANETFEWPKDEEEE